MTGFLPWNCHSDAHYRAGISPVRPLPLTSGHEVAGVVKAVGMAVAGFQPGDRVCLHYFEQAAIIMCSSSTAFHALQKARIKAGEIVAIFGVGGLGMSAVQLAYAMGAFQVFGVDINPEKLALAEEYGAIPIHAIQIDAIEEIKHPTQGMGETWRWS